MDDRWPRAIESIELFPAPRGKYYGLLTSQTLNNCILLFVLCAKHFIDFVNEKYILNFYAR